MKLSWYTSKESPEKHIRMVPPNTPPTGSFDAAYVSRRLRQLNQNSLETEANKPVNVFDRYIVYWEKELDKKKRSLCEPHTTSSCHLPSGQYKRRRRIKAADSTDASQQVLDLLSTKSIFHRSSVDHEVKCGGDTERNAAVTYSTTQSDPPPPRMSPAPTPVLSPAAHPSGGGMRSRLGNSVCLAAGVGGGASDASVISSTQLALPSIGFETRTNGVQAARHGGAAACCCPPSRAQQYFRTRRSQLSLRPDPAAGGAVCLSPGTHQHTRLTYETANPHLVRLPSIPKPKPSLAVRHETTALQAI